MSLSQEEIQHLSKMFLAKEDASSELALEIMKPHGLAKELLTEIFAVYKLAKTDSLKEKVEALLLEYGSEHIHAAMKRKFAFLTEKKIRANIPKYVSISKGELDPLKFVKALWNKYGIGLRYIMEIASSEDIKAILEEAKNGKRFELSGKNITTLPDEFFEMTDLEEINLSHNKLSTVTKKFGAFVNLKKLDVSNNAIKKINIALAKAASLEELNIQFNEGTDFPKVLGKLNNLRKLEMGNFYNTTKKFTIPDDFFQLQLTYLNIGSSTQARSRYDNWPNFGKVVAEDGKFLEINPLTLAKQAFDSGDNAPVYYLLYAADSDYKKKVLEKFYNPTTKSMNFHRKYIRYIPKEIGAFDIKILNLEYANYQFVEDVLVPYEENTLEHIGQLKNLEELHLYNSGIKGFPGSIVNCTKLKRLDFGDCYIREIPDGICQLKKLEYLNLGNFSRVDELPNGLKELTLLKEVKIGSIRIGYSDENKEEKKAAYKEKVKASFPEGVEISFNGWW